MNKKGGFQLDKWLIAIVIFGVFVVAGTLMIVDLNSSYGLNMSTDDFSASFNTTSTLYNTANDTKDRIFGGEIDKTDTASSMFAGAFSAIRLIPNSFGVVNAIAHDTAAVIGIPAIYIQAFMAIITILVIFALIQKA